MLELITSFSILWYLFSDFLHSLPHNTHDYSTLIAITQHRYPHHATPSLITTTIASHHYKQSPFTITKMQLTQSHHHAPSWFPSHPSPPISSIVRKNMCWV